MADLNQIADLLSAGVKGPQGPEDSAFHTGVVRSWNSLTGANTVEVNGVLLPNLRTLRAGIGVAYTVGETVTILRKQTQYFILGKIAAVASGGSSGIQFGSKQDTHTYAQNLTPFFPSSGVTVSAYLSSSARALIILSSKVTVYTYTSVGIGLEITKSDSTVIPMNLAPADSQDLCALSTSPSTADSLDTSITVLYMAKPEDGILPGLTSFKTMAVVGDASTPPTGVDIHSCSLLVIPL